MPRDGTDSYIVRIYRRGAQKPSEVVGLVEAVERRDRRGFKSMDELWEILSAPPRAPAAARRRPRARP
jgi:hypothetical protein